MTDLKRRFEVLDRSVVPDLHGDIRTRAAEPAPARGEAPETSRALHGALVPIVLLATIVAAFLLVRAFDGAGRTPAGSVDPNYRFDNVTVRQGDQHENSAIVAFDVEWENGFPGVHHCTWLVYGSGEQLLGKKVDRFVASPTQGYGTTVFDIRGAPTMAQASCDPRRLDDAAIADTQPWLSGLTASEMDEELQRRTRAWSDSFDISEMDAERLAANMDSVRFTLSREFEALSVWQVRELMTRMGTLCHLLPEGHPYRGGEFCD